jgi:hypothetical protein
MKKGTGTTSDHGCIEAKIQVVVEKFPFFISPTQNRPPTIKLRMRQQCKHQRRCRADCLFFVEEVGINADMVIY